MKNCFIAITILFILIGCDDFDEDRYSLNTDIGVDGVDMSSDLSSELEAPVVVATSFVDKVELKWSAVANAVRYEVRIDDGVWMPVVDTKFDDVNAPASELLDVDVNASQGLYRKRVSVSAMWIIDDVNPRKYEVRAIGASSASQPSTAVLGRKKDSEVKLKWQRSVGNAPDPMEGTDWSPLAVVEQSWDDNDVPVDGARRFWRVAVELNGKTIQSLPQSGWVYAAMSITTAPFVTCVVFSDGSVQCWGDVQYGYPVSVFGNNLGLGDELAELPVPNLELGGDVKKLSIAVGDADLRSDHFTYCALMQDGGVKCWGSGLSGALGNGRVDLDIGDDDGEMPPPLVDLGGKVDDLCSGSRFHCALMQDGDVKCWGANIYGQLGLGHIRTIGDDGNEMPPVPTPLPRKMKSLACGFGHVCAVGDDNNAYCWGWNAGGQLGLGHVDNIGDDQGDMITATHASNSQFGLEIVADGLTTCSLLAAGAVRCWGTNTIDFLLGSLILGYPSLSGNLGDEMGEMPPDEMMLGGDVNSLHLSIITKCALRTSGDLLCWGRGALGQLGTNTTANIGDDDGEMPPAPVILPAGVEVKSVALASSHSCIIGSDGEVYCWGGNSKGQLGIGNQQNIGDDEGEMPPSFSIYTQ